MTVTKVVKHHGMPQNGSKKLVWELLSKQLATATVLPQQTY